MEPKIFPEFGLPMARPKIEDTEKWSGASAAPIHPEGLNGVAEHPTSDRHLVARLPKYSGLTPLEPHLAQFRIAARFYRWSKEESAAQLALALEGTAVQVLMDLSPVEQDNLEDLISALQRRFGQRVVTGHRRDLLSTRRRREGERLGAYAADLRLYAQRGYPDFPSAARDELALHAFLQGLTPPQLGQHVRLAGPLTLEAALDVAERAERELSTVRPSGTSQPHVRRTDYEQDEAGEECAQAGTAPRRPWTSPQGFRQPSSDRRESGADVRRCHRCGEPGHLARDCPAPAPRARPSPPAGNAGGVAQ